MSEIVKESKGLVKASDLKPVELLSNEEIAFILPVLNDLAAYAKQVQDYAVKQILDGNEIEGYKVVEGRANRKYNDADAVAKILIKNGYNEAVLYEKSLKSLSTLEKEIGKKEFDELVGYLIDKPQGAPTLAVASDKRADYKKITASEEFADITEESEEL